MKVKIIETPSSWRPVADAARTTIGLEPGEKEPSSEWKRKMLLCEHSPIRLLKVRAKFIDLKSWVSVHFVRHKIGIEHFVSTQRTDRTGINRDQIVQSERITHEFEANFQAIINISRKRLCNCASFETRSAWKIFLKELEAFEPELVSICVPECIYRGNCYEYKSCNWDQSIDFDYNLMEYRKNGKTKKI